MRSARPDGVRRFNIMEEKSNFRRAVDDIREGVKSTHVWPMLGWLEIKQRYRRSVLGPFWLTLSTAGLVLGMGPLYARLFNQDTSSYFQFLAVSFVVWQFIAGLITDSCQAFIAAEGYIKQIKLPLSVHVLRVVWKNLIIFAHNFIIVVLVLLYLQPPIGWHYLLAPLGVLILAINGVWLGLLLGLFCARFRDIPPIITSLIQVALFLTPIMWKPEMLGRLQWTVNLNPLYHYLEVVRAPLLGAVPTVTTWVAIFAMTIGGYVVTLAFFARFRARVAYWV
jgi:ABC-type polysaccharide/polyol phosphate export permease